MGRKRKNDVCPACEKLGYQMPKRTWNGDYSDAPKTYYRYFRHYKTATGRRPPDCYVEGILLKEDCKRISAMPNGEFIWKMYQCRKFSRDYLQRISDMVNKTEYPTNADPFDFEMLSRSMNLGR